MKTKIVLIIVAVLILGLIIYVYQKKKSVSKNVAVLAEDQNPKQNIDIKGSLALKPRNKVSMQNLLDENGVPTVNPDLPPTAITTANCINTPIIVSAIKAYKEAGAIKRYMIKQEFGGMCPEALRYMTR